ncbi:hypothetical protein DdX_14898 [Ditylenchus destructor]|uniref:Uncharacterized protein n=1 Tax=Ditylenchus destructor TaxID=166010 RepID=A0AAD4MTR7_9BILA|nr:hypothetical protein DdX_14898 [Ditylenchus destructor]
MQVSHVPLSGHVLLEVAQSPPQGFPAKLSYKGLSTQLLWLLGPPLVTPPVPLDLPFEILRHRCPQGSNGHELLLEQQSVMVESLGIEAYLESKTESWLGLLQVLSPIRRSQPAAGDVLIMCECPVTSFDRLEFWPVPYHFSIFDYFFVHYIELRPPLSIVLSKKWFKYDKKLEQEPYKEIWRDDWVSDYCKFVS